MVLVKEFFHHNPAAVITNVAQDPQGDEKWTLGSSEDIEGTDFVYIPLVSEKKNLSMPEPGMTQALYASRRGSFAPSRNILFVNKRTGDMRWLFKGNTQLITHIDLISVRKRYDKDRMIDAILYQVITHDTNGEKKLGLDDEVAIALSWPDGSRYKEVIRSVERIVATLSIDGHDVLVLYQSEGKGYVASVRLANMSVHSTKEMPKVKQTT